MSLSEREIWACAHWVLCRHGAAASGHAAQRADDLGAKRDIEGRRVWLSILRAIDDLQTTTPAGTVN